MLLQLTATQLLLCSTSARQIDVCCVPGQRELTLENNIYLKQLPWQEGKCVPLAQPPHLAACMVGTWSERGQGTQKNQAGILHIHCITELLQ